MSDLKTVPCGDCNLCCRSIGILLRDGDYDEHGKPRFITMGMNEEGRHYLGFHNDKQMCSYLGPDGCVIHNDKPEACKVFDCRVLAMAMSKAEAVRFDAAGQIDFQVWQRGKDLILVQFQEAG